MSCKRKECAAVVSQEQLAEGIYSMWLQTEEIAGMAVPGQFISMYTNDGSKLLPRPISLCEIDKEKKQLRVVYRVTGEATGTEQFSKMKAGDTIEILGPLGNGFPLEEGQGKKAFLMGGGIGVPPILELAKQLECEKKQIVVGYRDAGTFLKEEFEENGEAFLMGGGIGVPPILELAKQLECEKKQIVVGYRDAGTFLKEEFEENGEVYISTEDGSVGTKGNVMDAIRENALDAEIIYACGPTPMLRAIKQYAEENNIVCYISMEERMACGIGACLACVCQSKEKDHHSNVHNKRVCKDGPVFLSTEVEL